VRRCMAPRAGAAVRPVLIIVLDVVREGLHRDETAKNERPVEALFPDVRTHLSRFAFAEVVNHLMETVRPEFVGDAPIPSCQAGVPVPPVGHNWGETGCSSSMMTASTLVAPCWTDAASVDVSSLSHRRSRFASTTSSCGGSGGAAVSSCRRDV